MEKNALARALTAAAVVFIVLLVAALVVNLVKLTTLNRRKSELESRIAAMEALIEENNRMSDYISTDEYIDRYAREYLNMQGKDEEAFTGRE